MRRWLSILLVLLVASLGGAPAAWPKGGAPAPHAGMHHGALADVPPALTDNHCDGCDHGQPSGTQPACSSTFGCMIPAVATVDAVVVADLPVARSPYGRAPDLGGVPRSTVPDPRPPRAFS